MKVKVKVIKDPSRKDTERVKLEAIKVVKAKCNLSLVESKDIVEGKEFYITVEDKYKNDLPYDTEFYSLDKSLRQWGYALGKVLNEKFEITQSPTASDNFTKLTVSLTLDGQIGVVSHRQIGERACLFLGNNVDVITTMLKEYFPSIKRIQVMPEKDSNNNTIRCCCIALSVGGEHNTIEDIIELGKFAAQVQENIQIIVDTCLRTGNLYNDFKGTFPEK